jgi:hypothetical protein
VLSLLFHPCTMALVAGIVIGVFIGVAWCDR